LGSARVSVYLTIPRDCGKLLAESRAEWDDSQ
jgi:hypothetical protein